jgi:hypothetical protein
MIQITLSFPTYAAAAAALSRLDAPVFDSAPAADLQSVTALQAAGAEPIEPAKRTRKAKATEKPSEEPRTEEQKAAAGAAMHAAARVEVPAAAPAAAPAVDKPVDYATEVAPLITRAANNPAFGPSKTLAVLQSYGARKGSEVPAERLGDLKLELEEALAAAEVAA